MDEYLPGADAMAPNEPIPDMQVDGNEDDDWLTEDDGNEEVFVYCLGDEDMARRKRSVRYTTNIDYKARLIEERKHWKDQEEYLTLAYMHWKTEGIFEEANGEGIDSFDCKLVSLDGKWRYLTSLYHANSNAGTTTRRVNYMTDSPASAALVRAGFVPSAPLIPSIAYDIKLLELYRVINKNHRRLGLQPFLRSVYDYQGKVRITASAYTFSRAYDCYLSMRRIAQSKVDQVLGRGDSCDRLKRACSACLYSLEGEPKLPYSLLASADGNMSLRRFNRVGTADTAVFDSSYFVSRSEVDRYADGVQVRKKADPVKSKGKAKKPDAAPIPEDEDEADADLEAANTGIGEQATLEANADGGLLPTQKDPFDGAFEGLPSECAEKWKANADDNKKVMWDVFDECGIFITVCRHGIVLLACDMVRSGEL